MTALTDLLAGRTDPGVYTWRPQAPPTENAAEATPHEVPSSTAQPSTGKSARPRAVGSATPSEESRDSTDAAGAPAANDSHGAPEELGTQRSPVPHDNAGTTARCTGQGTDHGEAMAWAAEAVRAGWRPVELHGRGVADKEAFLRRCADAFGFPEWFGMNWDALEDSLTDLDWLPSRAGYLVVYDSWDQLASADPGSFRAALDVFAEAVESWRDSATPMAVLLPTTETITGLPHLN